jgi:hypothetical protein
VAEKLHNTQRIHVTENYTILQRIQNVYWEKTDDILGYIHIVRIEKLGAVLVNMLISS